MYFPFRFHFRIDDPRIAIVVLLLSIILFIVRRKKT